MHLNNSLDNRELKLYTQRQPSRTRNKNSSPQNLARNKDFCSQRDLPWKTPTKPLPLTHALPPKPQTKQRENMKRIIYFLILISLLGCNPSNNYKTITLKTSGSVEVKPDIANIVVQISCINKDIEQAKNCLLSKSSNLSDILTNFKIDGKDILTSRVDLNKDFLWKNNSQVFNGYRASTTVNVKIRELKTLEKLYPILLTDKEITLGDLTYQSSNLEDYSQKAYLQGLGKANRLAEKILAELPEKNKTIIQISNIEIPKSDQNYKKAFQSLSGKGSSDKSNMIINVGNLVVERQIFVEYKIY